MRDQERGSDLVKERVQCQLTQLLGFGTACEGWNLACVVRIECRITFQARAWELCMKRCLRPKIGRVLGCCPVGLTIFGGVYGKIVIRVRIPWGTAPGRLIGQVNHIAL